jgi:hypothetical protein
MTNAELAILSLIAEQPRHGYDIEQVIEHRGMRNWTEIGFSSIYYLLNKLEKAGLITSELRQPQGKGPARKVYSVTEPGLQVQFEETIKVLSTPHQGTIPFLMGLANFPLVPQDQVLLALNTYAAQLEDRLDHMLDRAAVQQPIPPFVQAMFDYSQALVEAELNWIKNFIQAVEAGNV